MEAKPVKMRLHFFHLASWRTKKWTIHLLTLFLLFFHVVFLVVAICDPCLSFTGLYDEEYIGIGIYISLVKMKLC